MRVSVIAVTAALLISAGQAQARPKVSGIGQRIQRSIMRLQEGRLLRQVGDSRYTSNTLKGDVRKARHALSSLRQTADRVSLSRQGRTRTATYFKGSARLGQVTYEARPAGNQRSLSVTRFDGNKSQTHRVFRTGRNAVQLVAGELARGVRTRNLRQAFRQIKGEMKHGSYTAGSEAVGRSDIGRADKKVRQLRVERWNARGTGVPHGTSLGLPLQPRANGKVVVGSLRQRVTQYKLDGQGNRIPHPDPEAMGRFQKQTSGRFKLDYYVAPKGEPVFQATAQGQ